MAEDDERNSTPNVGYLEWNDALARRFFNEARAYQQVYLYVTEEVVGEVGQSIGSSVDGFLKTVCAGPPNATRSGHCQRALGIASGWRTQSYKYPPYLAYLALFVLAGGQQGEFAPHAYYPRLWRLLGEPGEGSPPSFDRMLELWDDLERWSSHDLQGSLGVFEARVVGEWIHVGLPLAQTVLTEAERHSLPEIFSTARLDPGVVPSRGALSRALTQHGRNTLRPRTISSLERGSDSLREALLDIVLEDFEGWDGRSPVIGGATGALQTQSGLRFCLAIDRVARRASASVRILSKRELPESGIEFRLGAQPLVAQECIPEWSHPLTDSATQRIWEPPATAWTSGINLVAASSQWRASSRATRVRAFIAGTGLGLPNLIETVHLPRRDFYLAFNDDHAEALREWASVGCAGWHDLGVTSGLPSGWHLAQIDEALSDDGPRAIDPLLSFPDRVSARLVGGLRTAPSGNSFFAFAPPRLSVVGLRSDQSVWCDGTQVPEAPDSAGEFPLQDLPTDRRLVIEIRNGEEVGRRVSLHLSSGFGWRLPDPIQHFDGFGNAIGPDHLGAMFVGASAPEPTVPHEIDLLRTPGLPAGAPRIYAIGRVRGQISLWPADPAPEWDPVWLLAVDRRGRPVYCASSLEAGTLASGRAGAGRNLDLWHRVLWQHRRRTTPPALEPFRGLWRRYQGSARAS